MILAGLIWSTDGKALAWLFTMCFCLKLHMAKESAYSFAARPQERRAAAPKRKPPAKKDLF